MCNRIHIETYMFYGSRQLFILCIMCFIPKFTFVFQQESEISNMENRNYFSLHCVQMETQLIHANLAGLFYALENMVNEEAKSHHEVGIVLRLCFPMSLVRLSGWRGQLQY